MIALDRVSKSYRTTGRRKRVLDDVTAVFADGANIGVLGANGAGKSTLLRILSGTELPDRGMVRRTCRVSFPLGFSGAIHPNATGRENVVFVSRVYGIEVRRIVRFVEEFAELEDYFDMPTRTYSSGMLARLAFGLSLAIDFDVYLVDEITAVGDARFQARCREMFTQRLRHASMIMVSHSFETIRAYCSKGAVLHDGRLDMYESIDAAISAYRVLFGVDVAEAATG